LRTRERLLRAARAIRVAARTALIEWKGVTHDAHGDTITSHVTFHVEVEEDIEDGVYVASCMNLPGCFSQGATEDEAVRNIVEAIAGVMEARMERHLRERPLHPPGDKPDPSRPHRHELVISA
jgi:predicted RNase H-like HicB family nuclease